MLYLVGTPIGNLEDISERTLRILREADAIGAEDTRHTRKLLTHFDIHTSLFSFHQHNEQRRTEDVISRLKAGEDIAIVSDAGMPSISDAGRHLVTRLREEQLPYTCVPGSSAVETALVLSGLPTESYAFLGFVPRDTKDRTALWQTLDVLPYTAVLFESPKRLAATLEDMNRVLPGRQLVVARELTKMHEEIIGGTGAELLAHFSGPEGVRGECVLVVSPSGKTPEETSLHVAAAMVEKVRTLTECSRSVAARIVAELTGIPRSRLYRESLEGE